MAKHSDDWSQFFITRVAAARGLPDLEILTLPSTGRPKYADPDALIRALEELSGDVIDLLPYSANTNAPLAALRDIVASIPRSQYDDERQYQRRNSFVHNVYEHCQLPILNSPLNGATLKELAAASGPTIAFVAAIPHDAGHIVLYFMIVAGTRIVIGASGGVAAGLKAGLENVIRKWMGLPGLAPRSAASATRKKPPAKNKAATKRAKIGD
jgi:hypothetical protein